MSLLRHIQQQENVASKNRGKFDLLYRKLFANFPPSGCLILECTFNFNLFECFTDYIMNADSKLRIKCSKLNVNQ